MYQPVVNTLVSTLIKNGRELAVLAQQHGCYDAILKELARSLPTYHKQHSHVARQSGEEEMKLFVKELLHGNRTPSGAAACQANPDAAFALLRDVNNRLAGLRALPKSNVSQSDSGALTTFAKATQMASKPGERDGYWCYTYCVSIVNHTNEPVQLMERQWSVMDMYGNRRSRTSSGILGARPILEPGAGYDFSSAATLATALGSMWGTFNARGMASNQLYQAQVAPFALSKMS